MKSHRHLAGGRAKIQIMANDNDVGVVVVVEEVRRRRLPRRQRRQSLVRVAVVVIIVTTAMVASMSSNVVSCASAEAGWAAEGATTRGIIEMDESTFYANFVPSDGRSGDGRGAEKEEEEGTAATMMDAKAEKVSGDGTDDDNDDTKTKSKAARAKTNKIVKGGYYGHGYTTTTTTAAPSSYTADGKTGKAPHLQSIQSSATAATSKEDRQVASTQHYHYLLKCKKPKAAKMHLPPTPPTLRNRNLLGPYYDDGNNNSDERGEQRQSQQSSTREGGGGDDIMIDGDDGIDSTTGEEEIKVVVNKEEEEEQDQEQHFEITTPVYYINNKTNSVAAVEKEIIIDDETTTTTTTTTMTTVTDEDDEYDYICDDNGRLLPNITTYNEYGQVSFPEITTFVPTISPPSEVEEEDAANGNGSDITDINANNDDDEPTDGGISPGCDTWDKYKLGVDNVYYETNISAIVDFTYEIVIRQQDGSSSSIDDIVTGMMENRLALLVGRELINCDTATPPADENFNERLLVIERQDQQRLQQQQHGGDSSRRLYVDGLVSTPMDEVVPDAVCEELVTTTKNGTYYCHVVNSKMTIYLRENDAATSIYQSTSDALKVIQTAMNDMNPSPFVEESDDTELGIMGVQSVRYIRGMPDEGMDYVTAGNGNIDEDTTDVNAITKAAGELGPLSTAGIALVAIGSVAMLGVLIGLLVTAISKKRKRHKAEGDEGKRDGDDSPSKGSKGRSGKRSPRSGLSTPQTYIEFFGEDDSEEDDDTSLNMRQRPEDMSALPASSRDVFNSLWAGGRKKPITQSPNSDNQSIPSDEDSNSLFSGLETGGGTSTVDGDRTVMTNRDILSVYNRDDNRSLAMTVEQGYEVKFRPSSDGGVDDDVSFWRLPPTSKYEPKVELVSPRYVNPARLKASPSRIVGDTVDF